MGLRIRKFPEIFNSLVTWITSDNSKLSDFNTGSALRTLTEATALQIEEFYFNMKQNVEHAIDTAIYNAFGFEVIRAQYSGGYIQVKFTKPLENPLIIPAGFLVSTSPSNSKVVYYKATDDTVAEIGFTEVLVKVSCTEIGTIGNCEVGEINAVVTGNSLIESVTNLTRFSTGVDSETKADTKARFREYLKSLGRATRESIEYGVKTVDGVSGVYVDDNYIGFVNVYCHNEDGDLPESLKSAVSLTLDDYRAGGIEVRVLPIVKHPLDLNNVTLVVRDNTDMTSIIDSVNLLLTNYLNSYSASQDFFVSDLITTIMNSYSNIIVTLELGDLADIKIQDNELIVAGDVQVGYRFLSDWR